MADTELLVPRPKSCSNWMIVSGLMVIQLYCIWQAMQERFLSRDCVELSVLDINITKNSVICSALCIYRLVTGGVSSFLKKYGIKRTLIYLSLFSVLAYVFVVHVLGGAEIQITRFAQDLLLGERLKKSVVEIDELRGPIKVRHATLKVPYSLEEHTKYAGEDVQFECYRLLSFEAIVIPTPDHVVWTKNGQVVKPSDRINITWTFENVSETEYDGYKQFHYMTSSVLKITFIEPNDFGNYSCSINNTALHIKLEPPPKCPLTEPQPVLEPQPMCYCVKVCYNPHEPPRPPPRLELPMFPEGSKDTYRMAKTELVKVFSLVKMEELDRVIRAPLAGIVSVSATYDTFVDIEDVSIDYNIGGRRFHSMYDGFLNGCSLTVLYYWKFWHKYGHTYDFTTMLNRVRMENAITGTEWQCVYKETYKFHSFSFYRRIFNVTSGREEIWEAKYPHRILLSPRSPDLFFYNFTNKTDPVAIKEKNKLLESIVDCPMWNFFELKITFYVTMVILLLLLTRLLICVMYKCVLMPIRNRILEGSWFPCEGCVKTINTLGCIKDDESEPKHDVYISYDDHHLEISEQLANVIEQFGYTTFHQDRDLLGGQLITEAVSNAICASKRFVVLLTKEYIDSSFCNRFEFQLIFGMVFKHNSVHYDRLLIINRDKCYIPKPLKNGCILEWKRNIDLEALIAKHDILYNWLQGKVRDSNLCNCLIL